MATAYSNEAVVAYLKRVADLNMLEVSMWDYTGCGVKWRSTHTNKHFIAAICCPSGSFVHESSLNWPLGVYVYPLIYRMNGEEVVKGRTKV